MKTAALENTNAAPSRNRVVADLAELVKGRLTLLVLLTTVVGFYLGSESPINYVALFHVVFGTAAAAAGAAALNQWWERRADALMRRTKARRDIPPPLTWSIRPRSSCSFIANPTVLLRSNQCRKERSGPAFS